MPLTSSVQDPSTLSPAGRRRSVPRRAPWRWCRGSPCGSARARPSRRRRSCPARSRSLTTEALRRSSNSFSSPMRTRVMLGSDLAEELEQDDLLLERLEHGAQRALEVEQAAAGEVGGAGERDPLLVRSTSVSSSTVDRTVIGGAQVGAASSTQRLRPAAACRPAAGRPACSLIRAAQLGDVVGEDRRRAGRRGAARPGRCR